MSGYGRSTSLCTECPLREMPAFVDFTPEQLAMMHTLKIAHRRADPDTPLLRAGDPEAPLLTLVSGWAFRYRLLPDARRQILALLLPGDTVGFDAMLTYAPEYSVQTASTVAYCVLDIRYAIEMLANQAWFRTRVLELMWRERREADNWLARTGRCSAEERIASLMIELDDRLTRIGHARNHAFTLRLTQQQMADAVGLNVVHLNRVLRRLRAQRLLTVQGHEIVLEDVAGLRRLVPLVQASPLQRALL